jgi:hypothetical protein
MIGTLLLFIMTYIETLSAVFTSWVSITILRAGFWCYCTALQCFISITSVADPGISGEGDPYMTVQSNSVILGAKSQGLLTLICKFVAEKEDLGQPLKICHWSRNLGSLHLGAVYMSWLKFTMLFPNLTVFAGVFFLSLI